MRNHGWVLALVYILSANFVYAQSRDTPDIWFAPLDKDQTVNHIGSSDFMGLFAEHSQWPTVLSEIRVFKLYPFFVGRSSIEDLRSVVKGLSVHHISIAVEVRGLTDDRDCKGDGGDITLRLLRRLKSVGADVRYLALDEPVKHWLTAKGSCRASVERIAQNLAENVAKFRAIYPDVRVGDVEPVGDYPEVPTLVDDLIGFSEAYENATRSKLEFLHADVTWRVPWKAKVVELARRLKSHHVKFGFIVNGTDTASSDTVWSNEADRHLQDYRQNNPDSGETLIFQSWVDHPTRVLPETDPTTLTGVIYRAHQERLF